MPDTITIYTDGAARGNPGPSASGFLIHRGKAVLHRHSEYNGIATNNYAEYRAVLLALRWCASNIDGVSKLSINLYSDSELIVKQLNGQYKIKSESLKKIHDGVRKAIGSFMQVKLNNLRREDRNISSVDRELNALLDSVEEKAQKL